MDGETYSAHDVLMIREVGFAVLAPVDLVAAQVNIVCETHLDLRLSAP
jgi:hypothetical protein